MLLVSLSTNLSCVSLMGHFGLIDVPPLNIGHVFLPFCLPGNFLLDARHRKFSFVGCYRRDVFEGGTNGDEEVSQEIVIVIA